MRWEFDAEAGSLYVYLAAGEAHHQEEMPDGVIVDVDASGRAVGIEVVSAWAPFDFHEIAQRYALDESDIASLDFLTSAMLDRLNAPPGTGTLVRVDSGTATSAPARLLSAA